MMHHYMMEWLTLVGVFALAVMSPGPDFVVAVRNALTHGRIAGFFTAIGFGFGVGVHATYTLLGIAALLAKSILFFNIIKYVGAAYLIYMGLKAVRSNGPGNDPLAGNHEAYTAISPWMAFRSGFITNLLNPKACLFFLALFTQIIDPTTPGAIQILFGATCAAMVTIWFTIVAFVLTTPSVRQRFLKIAKWIDRTCGGIFIALGLKLAFTKAPV